MLIFFSINKDVGSYSAAVKLEGSGSRHWDDRERTSSMPSRDLTGAVSGPEVDE